MLEVEVLTGPLVTLGESPLWDVDEQRLYWVDVMEGNVLSSTADGRDVRVSRFPGHVTSIVPRASGGLVVASGARLHLFDPSTGDVAELFDAGAGAGFSFNDGKVDRQGRFVTGLSDRSLLDDDAGAVTKVDEVEPRGGIYRLDPDLGVSALGQPIGLTNGPCFSPDGATLYFNDSWARRIYAYDYDTTTGAATNRRVLASFGDDDTTPDGATVDDEGCVWVAAFRGGEVRRYTPEGVLDRTVALPVVSPTSVAFGGPDLDVLFVTSKGSAQLPGDTASAGPLDGCVFAIQGTGVRGIPELRFAG